MAKTQVLTILSAAKDAAPETLSPALLEQMRTDTVNSGKWLGISLES